MQELAIPTVPQTTNYSCGPAALCAVLRYYGIRTSERTLMRRAGTTREGTDPEQLMRACASYGVRPWIWEMMTYDILASMVKKGHPVIVALQAWGDTDAAKSWTDGHWVVVTGAGSRRVTFADPSLRGARGTLTRRQFERRWHDYDFGGALVNLGIIFPRGTIRRRPVGRSLPMS
jgi:predicted double-glycine peptidase